MEYCCEKRSSRKGDCVHFNSHTDVVEVGSGWSFDPFGGEVNDGKIYGRGTCDMKGGLASSIIAREAFLELFQILMGHWKYLALLMRNRWLWWGSLPCRKGFTTAKSQHVIIPEPLNKDRICLGHRGGWWLKLKH